MLRALGFMLRALGFIAPNTLKYLAFQSFDYGHHLKKVIPNAKFDIHVFTSETLNLISTFLFSAQVNILHDTVFFIIVLFIDLR